MTIYQEVEQMLENSFSARERKFRVKALRELVLRKLNLENVIFFPMEKLDDFALHFASFDRAWRQVMQHREDLRGSDYGHKEILEQEKEVEMGYEAGYHADVKKLATITN